MCLSKARPLAPMLTFAKDSYGVGDEQVGIFFRDDEDDEKFSALHGRILDTFLFMVVGLKYAPVRRWSNSH